MRFCCGVCGKTARKKMLGVGAGGGGGGSWEAQQFEEDGEWEFVPAVDDALLGQLRAFLTIHGAKLTRKSVGKAITALAEAAKAEEKAAKLTRKSVGKAAKAEEKAAAKEKGDADKAEAKAKGDAQKARELSQKRLNHLNKVKGARPLTAKQNEFMDAWMEQQKAQREAEMSAEDAASVDFWYWLADTGKLGGAPAMWVKARARPEVIQAAMDNNKLVRFDKPEDLWSKGSD